MFKDKDGALKEPTGKQIEPRALELGNSHLHRKVQGEDLFAREAQFHPSCRSLFNLKYLNHLRDTARATKDVTKPKQIRVRRHLHIWRHSLPCLILFKIPLLSREKFCCFLLYVFSTSKSWRKMAFLIQSTEVRIWKHDLTIMRFVSWSLSQMSTEVTKVVSPIIWSTVPPCSLLKQ